MRNKLKYILLLDFLLFLIIAYMAIGWYFSGLIVQFNVRSFAEEAARPDTRQPASFGLPQPENVRIPAGDVELASWLFINERDEGCGVVVLHGRSSTRYGSLYYAPLFWDRGCHLLLFDARYHGESGGDFGTYGYHEREDTLAALRWFAGRTGLDRSQIGLMGNSYGAATALKAAALEADIAFVAADSAYSDMPAIIEEQAVQQFPRAVLVFVPGALWVSGWRADFNPYEVSPLTAAPHIQAPVFLLHSLQDTYTVPRHSQEIYDAIPHQRKVLHLTDWGTPHGRAIVDEFGRYQPLMTEFLATHVPGFGGR
jgi:uncharacterized protein